MKLLMDLGYEVGVISGGKSDDVVQRMSFLNIKHFYLEVADKTIPFQEIIKNTGFKTDEIAFIGDEIFDIPILEQVGFAATVPNAVGEVKIKRCDQHSHQQRDSRKQQVDCHRAAQHLREVARGDRHLAAQIIRPPRPAWHIVPAALREVLARNHPQPGCDHLEEDRHHTRQPHDPKQPVAETGPGAEVRRTNCPGPCTPRSPASPDRRMPGTAAKDAPKVAAKAPSHAALPESAAAPPSPALPQSFPRRPPGRPHSIPSISPSQKYLNGHHKLRFT